MWVILCVFDFLYEFVCVFVWVGGVVYGCVCILEGNLCVCMGLSKTKGKLCVGSSASQDLSSQMNTHNTQTKQEREHMKDSEIDREK